MRSHSVNCGRWLSNRNHGTTESAGLLARGVVPVGVDHELDPCLNVDPGTASPLQHGDVFMSDNGPAPGPVLGQPSFGVCRPRAPTTRYSRHGVLDRIPLETSPPR